MNMLTLKDLKKLQGFDLLTQTGFVKVVRHMYSAILDIKTCALCQSLDSKVVNGGDSAYFTYMPPLHGKCFIDDDIPIYTDIGYKKIGDIKVGDFVLTHKNRYKKVLRLYREKNYQDEIIEFFWKAHDFVSIQSLKVTLEHSFLIKNEWKKAKDIKVGDLLNLYQVFSLKSSLFSNTPVIKIRKVKLQKAKTLYNFAVEEDESYIANGIVSKNCRCLWISVTDRDPNTPVINWKTPKKALVKEFAPTLFNLPAKVITKRTIFKIDKEKIEKQNGDLDV